MFDPSRVQAIFFDLDGTLIDTDDAAVARLARPLGWLLGRRAEGAARWFMMKIETPGNAAITFLDWLHLDRPVMRFRHWLSQKLERQPKSFQLIPGTEMLIAQLSGRFPLALVTTRSSRSALMPFWHNSRRSLPLWTDHLWPGRQRPPQAAPRTRSAGGQQSGCAG